MRKMEMRLQKNQLPGSTLLEFTASGGTFDRSLYSEAGYTNYDILLVGGSGGKSGNAYGNASHDSVVYTSGGGGGGSLRLQGKLADLPVKIPVTVGGGGANGPDSAVQAKAGDGDVGGTTSFNGHSAYGGTGAIGGDWDVTNSGGFTIPYVRLEGHGGNGGGNSANLGSGGIGGITDSTASGNSVSATSGTYVVSSPSPGIVGGGKGGGGGTGAIDSGGARVNGARAGFTGSNPNAAAPGDSAGTNVGGGGGGADAGIIIGGTHCFGNGGIGEGAGGVVAIKIS